MTYQNIPKIGLIGPQSQSIDLALELAVHMASKSNNYSGDEIPLDKIMDFQSTKTPVWNSEILSIEFKDLDKFNIQNVPSPRKALSLSKKYPEVVLSIDTAEDTINVLNGLYLSVIDDHDMILQELMSYWDIETINQLISFQKKGRSSVPFLFDEQDKS